jgi:signal transduction histidine kinase
MPALSDPSRAPGLWPAVTAVELGGAALELLVVAAPLGIALRGAPEAQAAAGALPPLVAAVLALGVLPALEALRPLARLARAKRQQRAVSPELAAAAQRALVRAPLLAGTSRFALWVAALAVLLPLARRGGLPAVEIGGLLATVLLHAGAAAALRAVLLGRILGEVRAYFLPNVEGIRIFAGSYRASLVLLGGACLGLSHAALGLFAGAFTSLPARDLPLLSLLLLPVLAPAAALWTRSLWRRARAVEAYFDVTIRGGSTRGPARDEPRAVSAFVAAQALPYRLAGYHAFSLALAGVVAAAAGRRLFSLSVPTTARLLAVVAIVALCDALYGALVTREALRPLMRHLGSRHALPVAAIRARIGLRGKLFVVLLGAVGIACGTLALHLRAPRPTLVTHAALGLGFLLVAVLAVLVVRALVAPIQALESRSEEMARGELARPVPPSGEADEIGRLSVAFEEMRRALRDRLRSTESINVDLEREVRRRTEALEQRNAELKDALDKLRRAQDNLVRSEKLASMGRLVAGIAHEINNPVNAVINSLGPLDECLRELHEARDPDAAGEIVDAAREMLGVVQRGAARTKAIVQALHNYSRGDESVQREVNLARSVDDSLDLLRHRLRDVTIQKEIDPAARILGYAGQIDQVLMNLVTNAAQALGGRGGTIRIGAAPRGEGVEIWVADDGPGIPAEVLPRIFDPFFTTKDVGEGSGLGLSIVHGIVERHGGRIEVDSAPGRGTTFRMTFPREAPAAASGAAR